MINRIRPSLRRPLLYVLIPLAAFVGCIFDPKDPPPIPPPPPFQYPDLSTPQNVILNLRYSWERKDSVRTKEIYDDSYQGESTDNDLVRYVYTKGDEVTTVGGLAKDQNVQRVTFSLSPVNTWIRFSYSSDPAGWAVIQLQGYSIQVDDAVHGTLIASEVPGSSFEFKFVPTLDSSSPTDTTWKIVHWKETRT